MICVPRQRFTVSERNRCLLHFQKKELQQRCSSISSFWYRQTDSGQRVSALHILQGTTLFYFHGCHS